MALNGNLKLPVDARKSNHDFLNRFQGRTSSISKAGLLSILDKNITPSYLEKKNQNESIGRYAMESKILPVHGNPQIQIQRRSSQPLRLDVPDHRSSNQSFKTDLPRKASHEQMGNKKSSIPKLPTINSTSRYQMMNSAELHAQRKSNLDKHSIKHLEFLNMFEERLKGLSKRQI